MHWLSQSKTNGRYHAFAAPSPLGIDMEAPFQPMGSKLRDWARQKDQPRQQAPYVFSHRSDQNPGYRQVPVRILWPALTFVFTNSDRCCREMLSFPRRRSPRAKSASSAPSFALFLPSRQHSTTSIVDEKCCLYQEGGRLGPNLTPLDPVWPHFSPSVSIQRHHLAGFMKTVPSDSWSPHIVKGLCQGSPIHFVLFCQLLALNRYGT